MPCLGLIYHLAPPSTQTQSPGKGEGQKTKTEQDKQQLWFFSFSSGFQLNTMQSADKRTGVFLEATIPGLMLQL